MSDHYWNKDNFETLEVIAKDLERDENFQKLAEYCRLRAKGLRKPALTALNKFIEHIETLDVSVRRNAVNKMIDTARSNPDAHMFMTTPLQMHLIKPTLDEWLTEDPDNLTALRLDGLHHKEIKSLRAALEKRPDDDEVRRCLVNEVSLQPLDWATHHIGESVLISSDEVIEQALNEGKVLLSPVEGHPAFARQHREFEELQALLADFNEFKKSGTDSFPDWCKQNDRRYEFGVTIYYEK